MSQVADELGVDILDLLLTGSERLDERDRILLGFRVGDWKQALEQLVDNYDDAAVLLDKAIAGCQADEVAEIRSLGNTLASWRTFIRARASPACRPPSAPRTSS